MEDSHDLSFDKQMHTVTYQGDVVTLNPLSFKLLEVLASSKEEVLSVNELTVQVWQKTNVSAETLKQRVFVLRQAIKKSNLQGITVQSVRGEGYRLLLEPIQGLTTSPNQPLPSKNKQPINKIFIASLLLILIALTITFNWLKPSKGQVASNNRIVLWSNLQPHKMSKQAASIYERWHSKLTKENAKGSIQLILSERQEGILIHVQARRNRATLVSYFEVIETDKSTVVKLSIVEPRTATILRTDVVTLTTSALSDSMLTSQLNGLVSLINSGKLHLNKQQRESSKAAIWGELRAIANPK